MLNKIVLLTLLIPSWAMAQGLVNCSLNARLIKASVQGSELALNGDLVELRDQLAALPFDSYSQKDKAQRNIAVGTPLALHLKESNSKGHDLNILLHRQTQSEIALTLEWSLDSGDEVLSTKVRVAPNHNLVFVDDKNSRECVVLSLKVVCP